MEIFMTIFLPLLLIIGLIALIGGIVGAVEKEKEKKINSFREEMRKAIIQSTPTWEQIIDIAETSEVPIEETYKIARQFRKDIIVNGDPDMISHSDLIESYITQFKKKDPFAGIPNEIKIHLERLNDNISSEKHILEPLTIQIRELVSIYDKEKITQKRYAFWGFIVGVLGIILAIYSLAFPNAAS